jgi:hypothetical protein
MPLVELECPHDLESDKRLLSGISQLSQEFDQGLRADGDLASVLLGGSLSVPFELSRKPLRIPFRQLARLHRRKKSLNGHNRPPERTRLTPLKQLVRILGNPSQWRIFLLCAYSWRMTRTTGDFAVQDQHITRFTVLIKSSAKRQLF